MAVLRSPSTVSLSIAAFSASSAFDEACGPAEAATKAPKRAMRTSAARQLWKRVISTSGTQRSDAASGDDAAGVEIASSAWLTVEPVAETADSPDEPGLGRHRLDLLPEIHDVRVHDAIGDVRARIPGKFDELIPAQH